jgi:hypothetical protein
VNVREVTSRYCDPVDAIWLRTAGKLGLQVRRSPAAYASYDGRGVLEIAQPSDFDADDCLAQMIFHELCHALVAGPDAMRQPDWGLCNHDDRDMVYERACQRLQAALSERHGLRGLMAVTTEHRAYWDALPADALADSAEGEQRTLELAREGWLRARRGVWGEALDQALSATARVASIVRPFTEDGSLWRQTRPLHVSGFAQSEDPTHTCATCAWMFQGGPGRASFRCRQTRAGDEPGVRIEPEALGCVRWEPKLDDSACAPCGACCREGFDLVPVRTREPIRRLHPELVHSDRHGFHIPRPGGRCLALTGDGECASPYRCRVYETRPRACAEFEVGGDACLSARRRALLSR